MVTLFPHRQLISRMDTITHGIVGALCGKALFAGRDTPAEPLAGMPGPAISSPAARVAIIGCTLGSIFPDIDIFAGPLARNPLAIMEWHRNVTHSAVLLPFWALLLAAVTIPLARWVKWQCPPFAMLYAIYAVGLATHVFLDLVTSFGTMAWSPLNYARPAWDWIFIIDLTLSSIALVPQLAAWCYRDSSQFRRRTLLTWALLAAGAFGGFLFARVGGYGFPLAVVGIVAVIFAAVLFLPAANGAGLRWTRAQWCRTGLALLVIYIGTAAMLHRKALADVERLAAENHLQITSIAALPLPPTLTHWVGLVRTPEGVWRGSLYEPGGAVETSRFYADSEPSAQMTEAQKLRDVQVFLWFARFPVWRVEPQADGDTAVEIYDVRFFRERDPFAPADPSGSRNLAASRPGRAGFTFVIRFDASGRVLSDGFKEPE